MAIAAFIDLVRQYQRAGMIVAEVGCWDGDSAKEWVPIVHANQGLAVLVDHFKGNPTAVGPHAFHIRRQDAVANLLAGRLAAFSRVLIIEGQSSEAVTLIQDKILDLCFIDADHRYSHVSRDIAGWRKKVKAGGILAGHDCEGFDFDPQHVERDYVDGRHHGVIKAVRELLPGAVLLGDSCWQYLVQ